MSKKHQIDEVVKVLVDKGMDKGMALKNLLETDMYFIDELMKIIK